MLTTIQQIGHPDQIQGESKKGHPGRQFGMRCCFVPAVLTYVKSALCPRMPGSFYLIILKSFCFLQLRTKNKKPSAFGGAL